MEEKMMFEEREVDRCVFSFDCNILWVIFLARPNRWMDDMKAFWCVGRMILVYDGWNFG
jgi:hypothetical protein